MLACVAASVGLGIAYALPSYVIARLASSAALRLDPDTRVLAYALVVAVIACVAFGLAPALHGTRGAMSALKTQRGSVSLRFSLRGFLLSFQIATSVVLLVCAGLLVRGVQRARAQDPGFAVLGVDVVSFELPANAYDALRTAAFFRALVAAIEELPGSKTFGLATRAPLSNSRNFTSFRLPGEDPKQGRTVLANGVSRGYFETLGIPLVAGRHFEANDATSGVLVNQALARRHWPDESAVGKGIVAGKPREIIGVVKDAYTSDLAEVEPTLYFPLDGGAMPQVLTRRGGGVAPSQVAAIAERLDPRVAVRSAPLAESLDRWLAGSRVGATLAGALGILAVTLAAVGIFGVFGYVVQQRTPEIGIRMALGARPKQIVGIVLRSSARALAGGLGVGILGALAASRLLVRHLYGLSPFDPIAYAGVAVILASAALAATYVPARRAIRVDPMLALRCE